MLITLDVGNTHTEAAIFKGREICERFEMKTTDVQSGAIGAAPLVDWLAAKRAAGLEVKSAVVASVVPAVTPLLGLTLSRTCNLETLVVSSDVKLNVTLGMDSKCTLGMDRMVNAMAAREYYKLPALVIDLGTASTFDFINSEGCFEGGAIAPGMQMGLDALAARTAKLPALKIKWPESVVGTNTEKAMLSGSVLGYMALVDGMVEAFEREKGPVESVIGTGGLGQFALSHSSRMAVFDADITFKGLQLVAELNGLI